MKKTIYFIMLAIIAITIISCIDISNSRKKRNEAPEGSRIKQIMDWNFDTVRGDTLKEVHRFTVDSYGFLEKVGRKKEGWITIPKIIISGEDADTTFIAIIEFMNKDTLLKEPEIFNNDSLVVQYHDTRLDEIIGMLENHKVVCVYKRWTESKSWVELQYYNEIKHID